MIRIFGLDTVRLTHVRINIDCDKSVALFEIIVFTVIHHIYSLLFRTTVIDLYTHILPVYIYVCITVCVYH